LIARPEIIWDQWSKFVKDEGLPAGQEYHVNPPSDGELLAEKAGRLCYMSFGKGRKTNVEFLGNIIAQKHFSVLEHANYTFLITGVSRSLTHELVRHRHFSFSQLSQRYVDHSETDFVMPPEVEDVGMREEWQAVMDDIQRLYSRLTHRLLATGAEGGNTPLTKALRTVARSVLPNAIETKIVVTGNARTWREFIGKRESSAADPEICLLAAIIRDQLVGVAPSLFQMMPEGE
jgi:thymidylate synthase (FAD)